MKSISKFFLVIAVFSLSLSAFSQNLGALRLFDRGVAKQNSEDYYGASEDFQQALQANPSYGEAWFHLSQVTYSLGDYSLALTYLDEADKYAKNRTDIQNLKGLILIALGRLMRQGLFSVMFLKNIPMILILASVWQNLTFLREAL